MPITLPNFPARRASSTASSAATSRAYLTTLPPSAPIKSFEEAYDYLKAHPAGGPEVRRHAHRPVLDVPPRAPRRARRVRAGQGVRGHPRAHLPRQPAQPGRRPEDDLDAVLQLQLGLISQSAFAVVPDRVACPPASRPTPAARSTSRSSAAASPRPSWSPTRTPTSRRPSTAARRRRSTPRAGAACPARASTRTRAAPFSGFAGPLSDALIAPVLDLERLDVAEIQRRFAAGTLTSAQLVKAYLDRIKFVNQQGPGINASAPSTRPRPAPRSRPTPRAPRRGRRPAGRASRCWSATRSTSPACPRPAGALALEDARPGPGRRDRHAAEGGRRDHPRQGQRDRAQRDGEQRHAGAATARCTARS